MNSSGKINHNEKTTVNEARSIQLELADKVSLNGNLSINSVRWIAGVDASISKNKTLMIGSVVLFESKKTSENNIKLEKIHAANCTSPETFPYIPGYLSFREMPVLLKTLDLLPHKPDMLIVDGHGYAHPRRLGIASHLGVETGCISIGCAKRRLIGSCVEPGIERGSSEPCLDNGEQIGNILRTRSGVSPVWISPGHKINFQSAVEWILRLTSRYRLPDPIRAAHQAASLYRKQ